MSLRGQTAIVGYGEIPHRRRYENRTYMGLFADAVDIALKNAGIRKEEITSDREKDWNWRECSE